jgi:hypothetical protein
MKIVLSALNNEILATLEQTDEPIEILHNGLVIAYLVTGQGRKQQIKTYHDAFWRSIKLLTSEANTHWSFSLDAYS